MPRLTGRAVAPRREQCAEPGEYVPRACAAVLRFSLLLEPPKTGGGENVHARALPRRAPSSFAPLPQ